MSFNKNTGWCLCERCGYEWGASAKNGYDKKDNLLEPKSCAKCKSKVWNQPRVYSGKYLNGLAPMAKRYKATGRKAAKEKRQPNLFPE